MLTVCHALPDFGDSPANKMYAIMLAVSMELQVQWGTQIDGEE